MALEVPYIPVYQKCCYFFSLRRGSIVIGWIFLIPHLFVIGAVCAGIHKYRLLVHPYTEKLDYEYDQWMKRGVDFLDPGLREISYRKNLFTVPTFIMSLFLILCFVDLGFCVQMMYGIYNERPRYMVAKLTTGVIGIVLGFIVLVYSAIMCLYGLSVDWNYQESLTPTVEAVDKSFVKAFFTTVGLIVGNALAMYFWNVVYSYYRRLEVGRQQSYQKMTETAG